jgi:tetratricopeptide (TPR) repeat protein
MHVDRISRALVLIVASVVVQSAHAQSGSDARQRQAAAEAYDQGTAAYLSGDYEKAAEWFETANRLSPAAPALIQAARAHQQAGHLAHAATLALRLTQEHGDDASATQVGQGVLEKLAPRLLRVDVTCDGCTLDVDGTLEESLTFFVEAGGSHTVTASFETGERKAEVSGQAGETKSLEFRAPPPRVQATSGEITGAGGEAGASETKGEKPLAPVYTFVGVGVTAALLIGSIVSTVEMNAGVSDYEAAAKKYNSCKTNCQPLYDAAHELLITGQGKETRTTVLWVVTGVAAAATGTIAALFTNWGGHASDEAGTEHALHLGVAPNGHGWSVGAKGRF